MQHVFDENPRRREFRIADRELLGLCTAAAARFAELPLFHRGESSEIRRTDVDGILVQRLLPSLNSISRRRRGAIAGTERLRGEISRSLWGALHRQQLPTCHLALDGEHVLISEERIPPLEVIVKAALIGTPARIYHRIFERPDRFGRPVQRHEPHAPYVRFDYRNPLRDEAGDLLRDECMPAALADRWIDVAKARESALGAFEVLRQTLARLELALLDACFLFDETGRVLCYELSPDNMRIKRVGWNADPRAVDEFDKDLWRDGAADDLLTAQWTALKTQLERA